MAPIEPCTGFGVAPSAARRLPEFAMGAEGGGGRGGLHAAHMAIINRVASAIRG